MFKKTLQKSIDEFEKITRLSRILPRVAHKATTPGTIGYVGKRKKAESIKMHLLDYNQEELTEREVKDIKESLPFKKKPTVTWLNISGVHNTEIIEEVGKYFDIHPLVLEDIANTTQRPKFEEYDDYLFTILKMVYFDKEKKEIVIEQVSLIVGRDYVISFQEKKQDVLEPLRERIRSSKGKIRRLGSDYLIYGIMDTIIDHYFLILEDIGEHMELFEDKLILNPEQKILNEIYKLKQELVFLRKSIWPTREVVNAWQKAEHKLIDEGVSIYFRDVYDHTIQVVETVETFRDMVAGMLDLYLSTISNKMNEIMKVLTIFAAIFILLTFVAGVYGMNFEFMPELTWHWAYPVWWAVIIILVLGMVMYFRKRKWL